jgi:orotate phosphoribosyltransferase
MHLPGHTEEEVVLGMYDRGLLVFPEGGKLLKSGRIAPYYYNARPSLSIDQSSQMPLAAQHAFRKKLINAYASSLSYMHGLTDADHVFGKAQAATGFGAVGAYVAGLSYL